MNRLLEKLAVFMICVLGFAQSGDMAVPVIALVITAVVSACVQIISGTKTAAVLIALTAAMSLFMPVFFCALPIMLYDAMSEKKWWLVFPYITVIAGVDALSAQQYLIVFVGTVVALIMNLRISGLEASARELRELRDEIIEKNMKLTSQNIRLASAQDNEVRLATLKERNRIAREIHDNVGHMLTRSILQTGALQIINKDEALKEPLKELKDTLDGAMTSIRSSVHDLHDDSIDLKKTLEDIASSADKRFEVTLNYDAGENVPGDIKLSVIGIVKESVSNSVRHSDGNKINIAFFEHPAFYQLLVEDNGSGSGTNDTVSRGIGLKNMEDRAAAVGGHINFEHTGKGFRVFMTIQKER